mmetsp:Transcript_26391/g.66567  ORF Transcript_26391/g.66567 Transcript_26391/m.66567 type:complete len:287 (+) Transcript_26391:3791-4651(+)
MRSNSAHSSFVPSRRTRRNSRTASVKNSVSCRLSSRGSFSVQMPRCVDSSSTEALETFLSFLMISPLYVTGLYRFPMTRFFMPGGFVTFAFAVEAEAAAEKVEKAEALATLFARPLSAFLSFALSTTTFALFCLAPPTFNIPFSFFSTTFSAPSPSGLAIRGNFGSFSPLLPSGPNDQSRFRGSPRPDGDCPLPRPSGDSNARAANPLEPPRPVLVPGASLFDGESSLPSSSISGSSWMKDSRAALRCSGECPFVVRKRPAAASSTDCRCTWRNCFTPSFRLSCQC